LRPAFNDSVFRTLERLANLYARSGHALLVQLQLVEATTSSSAPALQASTTQVTISFGDGLNAFIRSRRSDAAIGESERFARSKDRVAVL
jgi:hypothetical protein